MKYFLSRLFQNKNRGTIIFLCFFVLIAPKANAGVEKDTIIFTKESSVDPLYRSSIFQDQFVFATSTSWDLSQRILTLNKLELVRYALSKIKILIPTNIKLLQCPTFCITDSFLLLQDEYDLNWFLFIKKAGQYTYLEQLSPPPRTIFFKAKAISESKFLLTDNYNHHSADSVYNTSLCIYDARLRQFTAEIHPGLPCIGLSHFPQNWISNNSKQIALSEPCGNKIYLYDLALKLTEMICLPVDKHWIDLPENKIPLETRPEKINPKALIEKLNTLLPTFSRIETIHFVNDSILLVNCTIPDSLKSKKTTYIYNTQNRSFEKPEYISFYSKENMAFEKANTPSLNLTPYQLFSEGIYISLEDDNFIPNPNFTISQNETNKNNFYENNDPEFIIRISKVRYK